MYYLMITLLACVLSTQGLAATPPMIKGHSYANLIQKMNATPDQHPKWATIIKHFVGKPYLTHPIAEGGLDGYQPAPVWRDDGYDCMTFVNTVLALIHSHHQDSFTQHWLGLQYHQKHVHFLSRRHFPSLDWSPYLEQQGYGHNITREIAPNDYRSLHAWIDKRHWFFKLHRDKIPWRTLPSNKRQQWLKAIAKLKSEAVRQDYLPKALIADPTIIDRMPNGSIVEWVNTDPKASMKNIGSALMIGHMGFIIKRHDGVYFLHASSIEHQIIMEPWQHMSDRLLKKASTAGIAVIALTMPKGRAKG